MEQHGAQGSEVRSDLFMAAFRRELRNAGRTSSIWWQIEGKTSRRSHNRKTGQKALQRRTRTL
jgi:hypothetical protein